MNEMLILETILKQMVIEFEDMEVQCGFKYIRKRGCKWALQEVIMQSVKSHKFYRFYIENDATGKAFLSGFEDIVEVEQKERTTTIVYYEEVIR